MVQFFEAPTAGIYDDMDKVREYWRNDYNDAQQRYTNREARRSYATQQRRNMALSQDNEQFYAQNAGLFDDRTGMLGSIGQQRNVPAAMPTNLAATTRPAVTTPSAAPVAAPTGPAQLLGAPGGDPVAAPTTPAATTSTTVPPARTAATNPVDTAGQWVRVTSPSQLTPEQLRAHQDYIRANYGGVGSAARRESTQRRVAELGLSYDMHGQLLRRESGATAGGLQGLPETFDISQYGDTPTVDGNVDTQTDTQTEAGVADPTRNSDPYFQGINDTGAPLQPTPEMNLAAASIRHAVRRAQILAHHGDNAGADTAFAAAVQAQMQYIVQSRQVLFHAAAGGSRQAAEALIADVGGLDRSSIRVQPTQEATPRFIVQRNVAGPNEPPNWVSASGVPQDFGSFVNSLLNMADQAGAAGRAEAQQAAQQSMLQYQATLQEIAGRDRVSYWNNMTDLQKAQLDSDTRIALARGEGRIYTDPGTGYSWLVRPGVGPDGRPAPVVSVLQMQDLPGPNVDGNRNETVPTPTITPVG